MPTALRPTLLMLFCLLCASAFSQNLRADFTPDKAGGCSPLSVAFTNTTANVSASATWEWDFGNGNTSTLKDPAAIFTESKTYTVRLTVKDGQQSSVQTRTVTVYQKPKFDFSYAPAVGCGNLNAVFNANMISGDGAINTWHWDFGDGTTEQSSSPFASHYYLFEQTASVSLTGVSSYGCSNTIEKKNIIKIVAPLVPAFTADNTVLCDSQGSVEFKNTSTGPGTLSYLWEFGDGKTSTLASPTHLYQKEGIYTVKLTVTSSEGCKQSIIKNDYINVHRFSTDFDIPPITCEQQTIYFNSRNTPMPSQSNWFVNNTPVYGNEQGMSYTFPSPGIYNVRLLNKFQGCEQEKIKQVEIHGKPVLSGFIIDAPLCGAPATVKFKDTTAGAVKWRWDFNYLYYTPVTQSTLQNPEYTYNYNGTYFVRLEVENRSGCTSFINRTVVIDKHEARIAITSGYNGTCAPSKMTFGASTNAPISNMVWDFGDGQSSADPAPEHVFSTPGRYTVKLNYLNKDGCPSVTYYEVDVRRKPKADFSVQSQVCGNTPVLFNASGTSASAVNYYWDFGDGTTDYHYAGSGVTHAYQKEGDFTVRLIVNDGYSCADTITKAMAIHVDPPFPDITSVTNTCDGTRGMVLLKEASRQAQTWAWSIDGGLPVSYTPPAPFSYTFTTTGTHKAVLITTNGNCTVRDSVSVPVLLKQKPLLKLDKSQVCLNGGLGFSITNIETNPNPTNYSYNYFELHSIEWEDGTPAPGWAGFNNYWYNNVTGNLYFSKTGKGRIRIIIRSSYFNCYDTTNFVDLRITGPTAGIEVVTDGRCFNNPVILRDTSHIMDAPIVSRTWYFGDGQAITTNQTEVSHLYSPGKYYVRLSVTDANGCTDELTLQNPVTVNGVEASFSFYPTGVYENDNLYFNNSSVFAVYGQSSWLWDFGDGTTSTEMSPTHTYTAAGSYTVKLTATDLVTGCSNVMTKPITVQPLPPPVPDFKVVSTFIGDANACPPVKSTFSYWSNAGFNRLLWDFGDGFTLDGRILNPSHIYTESGDYVVTLNVYDQTVLLETWKDTIRVRKPPVAFTAADWSVCRGDKVQLYSTVQDSSYNYTWDFGNGYTVRVADSTSSALFNEAGFFTPALMITDSKGCSSAMTAVDKIEILRDPVIHLSPAAPVLCKENPVQLEATGAQTYQWSPANGLSNASIYNPIASPFSDQAYLVEGTDINGCKGQTSIVVTVPKPFRMQVTGKTEICKGSSTQLSASGAVSYLWINNTAGLSNSAIAAPVARPDNDISYTVVGTDQYKCYTDTIVIPVIVHPLPLVNAGADLEVPIGSTNALQVTGSSDIVRWQWTPAEYLNCTNCQNPIATPRSTTSYIVSGTTRYNCTTKDTILIRTLCLDNNVYIPTAFTPNNDGLNDRFSISANVSRIVSLQIFNRWGERVFEAKDFIPGSVNGSWNGRYKGAEAPSDSYVYIVVMECEAGAHFERKGTVTLLR